MANKNLPAFASVAISVNDGYLQEGLTKREYAFIQLMAAKFQNPIAREDIKGVIEFALITTDLLFEEMDKIENSGNIQDK